MSRAADWFLSRFGIRAALRAAQLNSKIDIRSGQAFLAWTSFVSGLFIGTAGYATYHVFSNIHELAREFSKNAGLGMEGMISHIAENYKPLVDEVGSETLLTAALSVVGVSMVWRFMKKLLDDGQRILINRLKSRMRDENHPKYFGILEMEHDYREADDAERIESGIALSVLRRVPLLGGILSVLAGEYYNLKYEKRQLGVLQDMGKYLGDDAQK